MAGTRHTSVVVYMIIVFGLISSEYNNNLYAIFTVFYFRPREAVGIRRNLGDRREVSQSISKVVLCTRFFRIQIH
jgi:hypothetical protein